jgi:hypothetical protein
MLTTPSGSERIERPEFQGSNPSIEHGLSKLAGPVLVSPHHLIVPINRIRFPVKRVAVAGVVDRDPIAGRTAQQLIYGQTHDLSIEVPQGNVDSGETVDFRIQITKAHLAAKSAVVTFD